jgi:hypothetical protein
MEIKVNNKDKLFLIAAIVGFIAFFLPWVGGGFFGQHSGYDLMTYGKEMGESKSWFLLLLPVSFLVVVLTKLQVIKNINPAILKIVEIIPIALIIFSFSKLFEALGIRLDDLGEMDGGLLEIFKIGFPLTLISSIILIFSPLSKQSDTSKVENNERNSTENKVNYQKTGEELGKNLAETGVKLSNKAKSLFDWLKENPKILYILGALVIVFIAIWLIFIKDYPKRDAKKLATELCECYSTSEKEIEEAYKSYLNDFENQNYIKRNDARSNLNTIANPINSKKYECIELVNSKYQILNNKFDYKDRSKFELTYIESQNNCSNTENPDISSIYSDIEKKIETIKDPEPDISKIKEDLIGQKIPGWNFSYLSEFKDIQIINTTKGNDRIEYKIQLKLFDENKNSEHDCEAIVIYSRGNDGWYFSNVKMNYITYINTIYPDKWTQITPLKNCKWNCEDTYKIIWKTNSYGREIISGPDAKGVSLPNSSSYYVKSREGKEVNVKFTYKPN